LAQLRSESDFQQIKDWNAIQPSSLTCFKLVWIRLPTNQGLKQIAGISREVSKNVWIRLPTNQGLKPLKNTLDSGDITKSESDFQQIKDWNICAHRAGGLSPTGSLNPTSNKSRIETTGRRIRTAVPKRLNPTSNKSRIETAGDVNYLAGSVVVWIRLPTNQGLKPGTNILIGIRSCSLNPTSNKSRIETRPLVDFPQAEV